MLPVVTPSDMAAVDARHGHRLDDLIELAGAAVAREAQRMLGGTYGRRVVVIAGPGNNGADGRVAARLLRRKGVRVAEVDARSPLSVTDTPLDADLVIDAAFGCGLSRPYAAPAASATTPVLAVDLPSGVDGLTGLSLGEPLQAGRTLTFVALKPGLLFEPGSTLAGEVVLAPLDSALVEDAASVAVAHAVTDADVAQWWPTRSVQSHKWSNATWIIGGSPGMTGAPVLAARGAQRAGAGYVRVSSPGAEPTGAPLETVVHRVAENQWAQDVLVDAHRFGSLAIGPGLGRTAETQAAVREVLAGADLPIVIDADALHALTPSSRCQLGAHMVLTPHDREFEVLAGSPPGDDRIAAAKHLAAELGAVVLLKGPATVIADANGTALVTTTGDQRLATAGSGDVLTGVIAALLAQGVPPLHAAAAGAFVHGRAPSGARAVGMVAGDIPDLLPATIDALLVDAPTNVEGPLQP